MSTETIRVPNVVKSNAEERATENAGVEAQSKAITPMPAPKPIQADPRTMPREVPSVLTITVYAEEIRDK